MKGREGPELCSEGLCSSWAPNLNSGLKGHMSAKRMWFPMRFTGALLAPFCLVWGCFGEGAFSSVRAEVFI